MNGEQRSKIASRSHVVLLNYRNDSLSDRNRSDTISLAESHDFLFSDCGA